MNIREKTYAVIRADSAQKREERENLIARLREDERFDGLLRSANSLRWDRLLKKGEEREKAEALLDKAEKDIKDYLSAKGYTEDILSDTATCELCNDTGVYEGKMCECAKRVFVRLSERRSPLLAGIPDALDQVDYSAYKGNERTYRKYASFLKKTLVDGDLSFAVISGKTGTAKTYLGCVSAREYMKKGKDVLALNALQLNQKFLAYHCAFLESKQELWDELSQPDLLYIDDLGVEPILNNVTVTYLYALLVDRMDKKTVITTNLDVMKMEERYGERILSRLLDKRKGAMMTFEGEDLRF